MKKQHKALGRRIIASSLAALLLLVPLGSSIGGKQGAKAEGPGTAIDYELDYEFALDVEDKTILGFGDTAYTVFKHQDDIPTVNIHVLDDTVKLNVTPKATNSNKYTKEVELSQVSTQIYGYDDYNHERDVLVPVSVTPKVNLVYGIELTCVPYPDNPADIQEYISVGGSESYELSASNKQFLLYAKPAFVDIEIVDVDVQVLNTAEEPNRYWAIDTASNKAQILDKIKNNELCSDEIASAKTINALYKEIAVCEYVKDTTTGTFAWTPVGDPVGTAYKDATIAPLTWDKSNTADRYVGEIKYANVVSETATTPSVPSESDEKWGNVSVESGYNYGFAGYFIGDHLIKELANASVLIDTTAPAITEAALYRSVDAGASWEKLDRTSVLSLNLSGDAEDYLYRYVAIAEDPSGIVSVKGGDKSFTQGTDTANFMNTGENGLNVFYYNISYNNDIKGKNDETPFSMSVVAEDGLGNKNAEAVAIVPTVREYEYNELKVVAEFYGSDGQALPQFPENTADQISVVIKAYSKYPISNMKLVDKKKHNVEEDELLTTGFSETGNERGEYFIADAEITEDDCNADFKGHRAEWRFLLPQTLANAMYDSLCIYVEDSKVDSTKPIVDDIHKQEYNLGEFNFDFSAPTVDYSATVPETGKWYQNYHLIGKIYSGADEDGRDSGFEIAGYYMGADGDAHETNLGNMVRLASNDQYTTETDFDIDVVPSTTLSGTKIVFSAKDNSNNELLSISEAGKRKEIYIRVDGEAPAFDTNNMFVIDTITDAGKKVLSPSSLEGGNAISGTPVVKVKATDNLTLDRVAYNVKYPDGTATPVMDYSIDVEAVDVTTDVTLPIPVQSGKSKLADGNYEVYMTLYDKSGRASGMQVVKFTLDNTNPIFGAQIASGEKGGKAPKADGTDMYYQGTVNVSLSVDDVNIDTNKIVVKDNGSVVNSVSWSGSHGTYTVSEDGSHTISIEGTDAAGNSGNTSTVSFIIDTVNPVVSMRVNGADYSESRGRLNNTFDTTVEFYVSDANIDPNDYYCLVTRQLPGQSDVVRSYTGTSMTSFTASEDGDYIVSFYAVDRAGRSSAVRTAQFRVDKTAPQLQILGASTAATSDTTVTLVMNELMWQDATAEATIYRRAGDGKEELVFKTVQIKPSSAETRISEVIRETGNYRIEFSAKDQLGHTTTTSQSFTMDKSVPIVSMVGVKNYDKTDESVNVYVEVNEDFYSTKTVSISGTRITPDGKTEKLVINEYKQNANPTTYSQTFDEDGIYDLAVLARDAAGNERRNDVHFTIDKTAPVIGSLDKYKDKMLREFVWDLDLEELVTDLSVCDVHMYLNGSEYDGSSEIEDGVYTLLITAEDELGHSSEKSVNFTLDTKAPVFIVTGVEDGQVQNASYSIDVSLQLEEDILKSVQLNGVPVTIGEDNTAHVNVTSEGDYDLTMYAIDAAGNEASQTISFTYGEEKKSSNLWIYIAAGAGVLVAGGAIFLIAKRRKNG